MSTMLANIVQCNAALKPDATAYVLDKGTDCLTITWRQYDELSSRLAAKLSLLALAPKSIVAILLPNGPLNNIAYLACEKAGFIALGLSPRAGRQEFIHLMTHTQAQVLITHEQHDGVGYLQRCQWLTFSIETVVLPYSMLENGEPMVSVGQLKHIGGRLTDPNSAFLINSTSGTTGLPKCVLQSQSRWFFFHQLVLEAAELHHDDIMMSLLPAPVGFGLWTTHFTPSVLGIATVLATEFDVEQTLAAIETHRVTVLAAVSTQFIMLLNSPTFQQRDFSSLRILYTGGERVPYDRAKDFEDTTGAKVLQFYGSNETGAVSCTTIHDPQGKRLRTAGRPIPSMNVQLLDSDGQDVTSEGFGQPVCQGPAISLGYYNDEQANRALYHCNGAVKTGDLASLDADGYLTVCGRQGDFIIRGGKNISGPAVEEAALKHSLIEFAAAVPMPDPVFGERVCLFVVLSERALLTLAELVVFLQSNGASKENLPERLEILDKLPFSSGGKVAKSALKQMLIDDIC